MHYQDRIDENYEKQFTNRFKTRLDFDEAVRLFGDELEKEINHKLKFSLGDKLTKEDSDHKVFSKFRQFLKDAKLGIKGYSSKKNKVNTKN